ncbi:MAG: Pr6Pr family membrane protein [Spirochaetaceae bacterium]|nr:Pr6Pr family membrane protein [Spirochaetaceae bacterium]
MPTPFKLKTDKNFIHKLYLLISTVIITLGVIIGLTQDGGFNYLSLRYFTYQSNILVMIAFSLALIFYSHKKFTPVRPYLIFASLLAITITGLIYNLVLVPLAGNQPIISGFANFSTHFLAMVLVLANYFIFEEKGRFKFKHLLIALIFPLVYWLIFTNIGSKINFYPYFFMDIPSVGLAMALVWLAIFLASFIILGLALLTFDKKQS